ncbi:epidermal growth factor receptor-like [Mizuhopecten yessoensis]|uniref:receptor protein-tyrosine kinase n=1 Tax=Mizuhopecten yessoensis TaxID=6573 RepID=A0A210QRD4_MIZYE|nr:epidermal growth factor receptor-like [Mizuhopecten yessoensis]OWF51310.1 Epidermal growth factor receptor [Mizuhopecten yessoensis]
MWGIVIYCVSVLGLTFVHSVEIVNVVVDDYAKTECQGTHVGFGFSGGHQFHYEALKRRYKDCTYVEGNLEITNLVNSANITYDLSFLSQIEVVTGYVLIGLLDVDHIPLTSLRFIRADNTYNIMGEEYGLVLALTAEADGKEFQKENSTDGEQEIYRHGLVELQLPSLKEISKGKVLFYKNPMLCFVNTVNWHAIVPGRDEPVNYGDDAYRFDCPLECDSACRFGDDIAHCWGLNPLMCQRHEVPVWCHQDCPGRCYDSYILGCCHPECAIGCYGPRDTDCELCKYFKHEGRCVSSCPAGISYRKGQECIRL